MKRLMLLVLLVAPFIMNAQSEDRGNDWRFFFASGYTQYSHQVKDLSNYGGPIATVAAGYSWETEKWEHGAFFEIRTAMTSTLGAGTDLGLAYKGAIHAGNWAFGLEAGTYRRFVSTDQPQYNNWDILTGATIRLHGWFANISVLTPLVTKNSTQSIIQYQFGYTQSIFNYH